MQHPDEGTIHAWLDGELPEDQANEIAAHARDCPECSATVAEARGLIAASTRILTALDNVPAGVIPAEATAVPTAAAVRRRPGTIAPTSEQRLQYSLSQARHTWW